MVYGMISSARRKLGIFLVVRRRRVIRETAWLFFHHTNCLTIAQSPEIVGVREGLHVQCV